MDKLKNMREEVRRVDREIIRLVGERLDLVRNIGSIKKNAGLPLLNYQVEKAVIENARAVADDLNLSPDFVKSVMTLLIDESRTQQERLHYSAYSGDKETILIVGGAGEMGRWLASFFEIQGHEVLIYDIVETDREFQSVATLEEGLQRATCVVISVSLNVVPETIARIAALKFKGLIFDIASIKGHLLDSIHKARQKGALITSIHPMFGPSARTLSDKVICFCDCGSEEALHRARAFFKDTAVRSVNLALDTHDRAISYVLGLSHISNVIYMNVLSASGFQYRDLREIASTTFLSQMITASSVINENPELYYLIQKYNPFKQEIFDQIKQAMTSVIESVLNDKQESFVQNMSASREWLNRGESSGKE
ncbi:prephenate dehydrogenase/arogenate dehydrogenase family protein [bacterium]|nr:prephenate dehydrogenase/arogenate dehydrogenase family protein [bacterium]MBU1873430.1 prephenate dehydrogenase/arogenate dehydrogenase family protein [bacterium]